MNRLNAERRILNEGAVSILRGEYSLEDYEAIGEALAEGGLGVVEVTLNSIGALEAIAALKASRPNLLVGAGSVLLPAHVEKCVERGAEFLVAPNFSAATVNAARDLGVLMIPGALTPTEVQAAYEHGCSLVKLFPAGVLGANYLKALRAPLDHIKFMPTGGITLASVRGFFEAGAAAVGIGSTLVPRKLRDPSEVRDSARAFHDEIRRVHHQAAEVRPQVEM